MKALVGGHARGRVLLSEQPINFLGMVDKRTGVIRDESHDMHGERMAGRVLVFPHGIGSSVGAYTIHSIWAHGAAPAAMICRRADLTVATGCAAAGIPMAVADEAELAGLRNGAVVDIDLDAGTMRVS